MLYNFLKIAFRNLFKYKYYSIVNILSFSIGLAIFATAYMYALDQLSYDRFNKKSDRIYRIVNVYEKDSTKNSYAVNPFPMAAALMKEFPQEIENACRVFNFQNNYHMVEYNGKRFNEKNFFYADSSILKIFDFDFLIGRSENLMTKPNTVIISESFREKYFGDYNPIGKEVIIDDVVPFVVEGVFKDFPQQSHVHIDVLTPLSSFFTIIKEPETWLWSPCWTYILLKKGVDSKKFGKKFPDFVNKYFDPDIRDYSSIYMQALTDIHLNSDLESEIETNSKSLYIYILFVISIFLLLVSCLNFINLTIVGSFTRIREISIRKIMGSSRRMVVFQFIVEAILLGAISLLVSLFMVEGLLPIYKLSTGNEIDIGNFLTSGVFFKIVILVVLIGVFVGTYSGIYASSFPIFNAGRHKFQYSKGKWFSGKMLILFQYLISLVILISVFVNFKQLIYLKNTNLGFDKEKTIILSVANNPVAYEYEGFKNSVLKNPDIESVTASNFVVGTHFSYRRYFYDQDGITKAQFFPELIVRHDFIKTMGIDLVEGTDFLRGNSEDITVSADEILINESMAEELRLKSNKEAIGKKLYSFRGNERIRGVIKDFNIQSLHNPMKPLVIRFSQNNFSAWEDTKFIFIKFKTEINRQDIRFLETEWKKIANNWPFEVKYLDDILNEQYKDEESLNFFLWIFSILIIIIGSMGVWAVSSLASIRKTKEIGIRKAIGASIREILKLFIRDFNMILIIANFVAWPLSWLILKLWFKNFANHIELHLQYFIYASLVILILTLAILTKHALKVALSNTVDSLRDE